jgi:hypothetical protein
MDRHATKIGLQTYRPSTAIESRIPRLGGPALSGILSLPIAYRHENIEPMAHRNSVSHKLADVLGGTESAKT